MVLNKKTKNKSKLVTNSNRTDKNSLTINNFNSSSSSSTSSSSSNTSNNHQYDEKSTIIDHQASTSLWIGNVDPSVTEEILSEIFSYYGQLANVRCLPEKYCAFVNFKTKEDAHKAMNNLQVKIINYLLM
jgi:RNA recognition motif-containing protein